MSTITIDRKTELVSVTDATRHLATLLKNLHGKIASKYFLAKNNNIEAVILPIEEYEKLLTIQEELDHFMLYEEIRRREAKDTGKRITLEELDRKYDLEG